MVEINIALDLLGIVIISVLFVSCLAEQVESKQGSTLFLLLLGTVWVALASDALRWICDGFLHIHPLSVATHLIADCSEYLILIWLLHYLRKNLFDQSRLVYAVTILFDVLCGVSILLTAVNIWRGWEAHIAGEYHPVQGVYPRLHAVFPVIVLTTVLLTVLVARGISPRIRLLSMTFPLFPLAGVIFDILFPGWSMTYIGALVCTLLIYTGIYQQKQRIIAGQRTALMISQINPHFMYNTLTTIASLCELSPKEARNLTVEFSNYLRHNIDTLNDEKLIPFEQELRHVGCYLKIEKARFGDRVNVIYAIGAQSFDLPALTVQPLVENAIRHGITKKEEGGTVKISTYDTDKAYVIEIKDDGVGYDTETEVVDDAVHVGLENVRNRLKMMCGGTLTVKSVVGVGTRVTVEIPHVKKKRRDV